MARIETIAEPKAIAAAITAILSVISMATSRRLTLQSAARLFASAAFALLAIEPTCASFMKESLTAQQQLRSRPKHASLLFPAQVFAARRAKVRMTGGA